MKNRYIWFFAAVAVVLISSRGNAGLFGGTRKIVGPAFGFVLDRTTLKPLDGVAVTVLPGDEVCRDKSAATDKDGWYKLEANLGEGKVGMRLRLGGLTGKYRMNVKALSIHARYEKTGYKPVEGEVNAYAVWTKTKNMKGRMFLPEVVLAPENSSDESVILNNMYFIMSDLEVAPSDMVQGQEVTFRIQFTMPKDPFIREGVRLFARHLDNGKHSFYMDDNGKDGDEKAGDNIFTRRFRTDRKFVMGENAYLMTIQFSPDITMVVPGMEQVESIYKVSSRLIQSVLVGAPVEAISSTMTGAWPAGDQIAAFTMHPNQEAVDKALQNPKPPQTPAVSNQVVCASYKKQCENPSDTIGPGKYNDIFTEMTITGLTGWHLMSQEWIAPDGQIEEMFLDDAYKFSGSNTYWWKMICFKEFDYRKQKTGEWTINTFIDSKPAGAYKFTMK